MGKFIYIIRTLAVVGCCHSQEGANGILNDVIVTEAILFLSPRSVKDNITFLCEDRAYRSVIDTVVVVGRRPACGLL